tara:strand:- start:10978 stop:13161 length:2184 start_codon:yes stop_codon:yes gene_type:complete
MFESYEQLAEQVNSKIIAEFIFPYMILKPSVAEIGASTLKNIFPFSDYDTTLDSSKKYNIIYNHTKENIDLDSYISEDFVYFTTMDYNTKYQVHKYKEINVVTSRKKTLILYDRNCNGKTMKNHKYMKCILDIRKNDRFCLFKTTIKANELYSKKTKIDFKNYGKVIFNYGEDASILSSGKKVEFKNKFKSWEKFIQYLQFLENLAKTKNPEIIVYNSPKNHEIVTNTHKFQQHLNKNCKFVKVPKSTLVNSIDEIPETFPIIIHHTYQAGGENKYLCNNALDFVKYYTLLNTPKKIETSTYEYINSYNETIGCYIGIRLMCLNNILVDFLCRPANFWKVGFENQSDSLLKHTDDYFFKWKNENKVYFENFCNELYKEFGCGFYAHDVILCNNELYITETGYKAYNRYFHTKRKVNLSKRAENLEEYITYYNELLHSSNPVLEPIKRFEDIKTYVFYTTTMKTKHELLKNIANGISKSHKVSWNLNLRNLNSDEHVVVVIGVLHGNENVLNTCINKSIPCIYIDSAYYTPMKKTHFSVSMDSAQTLSNVYNTSNNVPKFEAYKMEGEFILICPPDDGYMSQWLKIDPLDYTKATFENIRKYTQLPVKVRFKPKKKHLIQNNNNKRLLLKQYCAENDIAISENPLREDINNCVCLCTAYSRIILEALESGKPIMCEPCCFAYEISESFEILGTNCKIDTERLQNFWSKVMGNQYSLSILKGGELTKLK